MKKIIVSVLALWLAASCSSGENAVIQGRVEGVNSGEIVLSKLDVDRIRAVDTIKTASDGRFSCKVAVKKGAPDFYYLSYNRKKLASLLLMAGDKVSVNTDTLGTDLRVEGSGESVLLGRIEREMARTAAAFDSLSVELEQAYSASDDAAVTRIKRELGALYVKHKRSAIVTLMQNPYSFANVNILYQRLSDALPVFGEAKDAVYFQRAYDSLQPLYPASPYVSILKGEADRRLNLLKLDAKVAEVEEASFPELRLPDVRSREVALSSLSGKPFLLVFWSAAKVEQKAFNQELLELYNQFHPKGLEIYEVSVDTDKTAWATAVREQGLPWINVCDGLGGNSPAVNLYNIRQVPSLFIFDGNGDIVDRDVFDPGRLRGILQRITAGL